MLKRFDNLPACGANIAFHVPPGQERARRSCFPALTFRSYEDGTVDLLVFYDKDDAVALDRVPPYSEQNPRGWAWPEGGGEDQTDMLADLTARVAALEAARADPAARVPRTRKPRK